MPQTVRDAAEFDLSRPIAGPAEIRACLPFMHEMGVLSAVAVIDPARNLIVGYKDVAPNDPWVGEPTAEHPVFPGVLMCEAVAQLSYYYITTQKVCDPKVVWCLGGIEKAKFIRPVHPGDRLVIVGVGLRIDPRRSRFSGVGYVGGEKVFEATVILVPAPFPSSAPTRQPNRVTESVESLVAELIALEAGLPDPDPEAIRADCRWVEANWGEAGLAPYRGQFVAVLDGVVVGNGADSLALQRDVARARTIHPQRLVVVYVNEPGL